MHVREREKPPRHDLMEIYENSASCYFSFKSWKSSLRSILARGPSKREV